MASEPAFPGAAGRAIGDAIGDLRAEGVDKVDLVLDAGGEGFGAKRVAGENPGKIIERCPPQPNRLSAPA